MSDFKQSLEEQIRQRRHQMLVHSCLYYKYNRSVISDQKFDQFALDLAELQRQNPDKINIGFYDEAFADWTGDTGFHLPISDQYVLDRAHGVWDTYINYSVLR